MKLHWWTLIGGIALGFFVLPPVVSFARTKLG